MGKRKTSLLQVVFLSFSLLLLVAGQCLAEADFNKKMEVLAEKLTSSTSGSIIDVDNGTVYINLGEKDSVSNGAFFEVVELGDVIMHGGKAYYKEHPVGIIEVTRVRSDMSLAKIVHKLKPLVKGFKVYQITRLNPARMAAAPAQAEDGVIAVTGVDLSSVFRRLDAAGFYPGPYSDKDLSSLREAIKRFQKKAKLEENGSLDMTTWNKLKRLYDPQSALSDLAEQSAEVKPKSKKTPPSQLVFKGGKKINRIVLMEFNYAEAFNDLTHNIYESLNVLLIRKGYKVVERSKLDQVIEEQQMGFSGLIDSDTAQKLGKLVGGEIVLTGNVTDLGNTIAIRARMVDVEKGVAVTAAEIFLDKTPDILVTLQSGVTKHNNALKHNRNTPANRSTGEPAAEIKVNGFTCTLLQCTREDRSVTCDLMLRNNKNDINTRIHPSGSRIIDNFGDAYGSSGGTIGNKGTGEITMVKDIPIKTTIVYEGIKPSAEYATLVEIDFIKRNGRGWASRLQFRDIPFVEK